MTSNTNIFFQLADTERQIADTERQKSDDETNIFFQLKEEEELAEPEETALQAAGRHLARTGARGVETILGLPGDIAQLGKTIGEAIPDPEFLQREPSFVKKAGQALLEKLPTSEELKEVTQNIAGDYLAPQTAGEEFSDEIASDFSALLLGRKVPTSGGVISKVFKTIAKPFLVSLGSNLAKEGVKTVGGSETAQTLTKLGSMFLLDMTGRTSAKKLKDSLYKEANKFLPKEASVGAKNLTKKLNTLETRLLKGGSTPSKTPVITKINELQGKIKQGQVPFDELLEFKRDLNEVSASLFDLPKDAKVRLRKNFDQLRNGIRSTIGEYGKENPKFMDAWVKAEELHSTIQQSKKVRHMLTKAVKKHPHLAGIVGGALGVSAPGTAVGVAAGGLGLVKGGEMVAKIMKSPTLRKHYLRTIAHALSDDTPAMIRSLTALNNELKKEDIDFE